MRHLTVSLVSVALLAGIASAAAAQGRDRGLVELPRRPVRGGFYITGGIGDGLERYKFSDDNRFVSWLGSPAAVLRVGGTPSRSVRLGGELFGWWNSTFDNVEQVDATDVFGTLLLDAQLYPSPRGGFYVKAGAGFAHSGENFACCVANISESGFGWSVGAGYDVALSRNVAIAPTVDFYQGVFSRRGDATLTEQVVNLGVSLTFQSGRRYR